MIQYARKQADLLRELFFETGPYRGYAADRYDISIMIFLLGAVALFRFIIFSKTAYANGTDGYVYLFQVKSIIEKGKMHFSDTSLIYPYLTGIALVVKNYLVSLKIGIALLTGFFTVSLYYLALVLTGKRLVALTAAFISIFSPGISFFAMQFPKNFMGLVLFMFFLIFLVKRKPVFTLAAFGMVFITHRLMAGILLIYLFLSVILSRKYKFILVLGTVFIFCIAAVSIVLPGTLHLADLERLSGLLALKPQAAVYSFLQTIGTDKFHPLWIVELVCCYTLACIGVVIAARWFLKKKEQGRFYLIAALIALFLVFPFYRFDIMGAAYRFYLVSIPLSMVLMIPLLEELEKRNSRIVYLFAGGLAACFFVNYTAYKPALFDPPYSIYQQIADRTAARVKEKPNELLVAHKPLAEMIDFTHDLEVLPWKPEERFNKKRVWRVARDIKTWEMERFLQAEPPKETLLKVSAHYILVREDVWDGFAALVKKSDDEELRARVFSRYNPYVVRPAYLTRSREGE
ncbi:MAG: hypothetical protein GY754_26785 [bacterium]|nr:hypothetical protein [bacterium]